MPHVLGEQQPLQGIQDPHSHCTPGKVLLGQARLRSTWIISPVLLQSLLTWYIHLCLWWIVSCSWLQSLLDCLLLMTPLLFHAVSMWPWRGTPRQQLEEQRYTSTEGFPPHLPPAPPGVMHQQDSAFLPAPTHTWAPSHSSVSSRSPGVRVWAGYMAKRVLSLQMKHKKTETLEKKFTFSLKKLELLNPQHFRDKAILLMKPFLLT